MPTHTHSRPAAVAAQTYLLHLADRIHPDPRYRQAAQHVLAFLFGRNYDARSYVTDLGANPKTHPKGFVLLVSTVNPINPRCLTSPSAQNPNPEIPLRRSGRGLTIPKKFQNSK